jgi:hypothetical protein
VKNTIFGRWEPAVEDVYIRNGNGSSIGVDAYNA